MTGKLPPVVKVQKFRVGRGQRTFVIAEVGNNHNGEFELAKKTIQAAKDAGADAVKFQKREVSEVFAKELTEMSYDNPRSLAPTYGEHRRKLELSRDELLALKEFAEELGLVFFVTPFDKTSADLLESIGVHAYKVASFDVTNIPLLEHIARKQKPILLSTGMATMAEIDAAVSTILKFNNRLIINQCTSIYPTPDKDIDLNVVRMLAKHYHPLPVGYSGHELDILPTVVSVALGATTVERHFTLDKTMRGSDHHMSIEPVEFARMVDEIRRVEVMLGALEKQVHEEEVPNRHKHAKSAVSGIDIPEGVEITRDMIVFKSPGYGVKPELVRTLLGRRVAKTIPADTVITEEFLV